MAEIGSTAVATKAVDLLFVVAKKNIGYMWNCKENVEKFKNEVKSLKAIKTRVEQQIGIAKDKGDTFIEGVEEWLNKADVEISKAEEFLEQEANAKMMCFKIGMCGNWRTLYQYGKGATEMTPPLLQLQEHGKDFVTCVSVETHPPTQLDVYQTKNLDGIDTHKSALDDIIAALEDETKQIIGIYGLGGVGKTTLAKEVVARVKNNLLFADVAFNTKKLKGFVIQIGKYNRNNHIDFYNLSRSGGYLILSMVHLRIPLVKWLKKLTEGSRPSTILKGIETLSNIMPTLYDEGFSKFEHIVLESCPNVSCLVDEESSEKFFKELKHLRLLDLKKLEVIWKCRDEYISLTNLVTLTVWECKKLERVFTVSVAQSLVNLKEILILSCLGLEEVIDGGGRGDDESGNVIVFPSLTNIFLRDLHSLKSFSNSATGNCSIKYPSLVDVEIEKCESMKKWGPGIHETPNLKTLVWNHGKQVVDGPFAINVVVEKSQRKYQVKKLTRSRMGQD